MAQPLMFWWRKRDRNTGDVLLSKCGCTRPKGDSGAEFVGRAQGSTKKTAEQDAARQLLSYLASRPQSVGAKLARGSRSAEQH